MQLAAKTRAYWSSTFICPDCKKPRPWFLRKGIRCVMCHREKNRCKIRRSRAKLDPTERREKDWARQQQYSQPVLRARKRFYQIRKSQPKAIKCTLEELYPIYEFADKIGGKVVHIYRMKGKDVCGLHSLSNLRVFCPKDPVLPKSK